MTTDIVHNGTWQKYISNAVDHHKPQKRSYTGEELRKLRRLRGVGSVRKINKPERSEVGI